MRSDRDEGVYSTYDVFTPTKPARVAYVERQTINTRLVNALRTPGKQLVVYGHSGSGKTTLLLNKLHQLYEGHVTSRCMTGVTFEQLVLDAFDQLSPFIATQHNLNTSRSISSTISADYQSIKLQLSRSTATEHSTTAHRILPPQLTPQALARFMGETRCCWVLEDFHKIDEPERIKLSQVMKVFMDSSDEYPSLKVIALGATDTARQVVEYDPEMKNRVAEIYVPLMNEEEISQIIELGSSRLNINIDTKLIGAISHYANGLASVCHHICLNMCTARDLNETSPHPINFDDKTLRDALAIYLDEVSDSLKKVFDTAFKQEKVKKFDNARLILNALTSFPQEGAIRAEIYQQIKKIEPSYPQGNLTIFLQKLSNDSDVSVLRVDPASGRYSFRDPIYRTFALAYFDNKKPKLAQKPGSQLHQLPTLDVEKTLEILMRSYESSINRSFDTLIISTRNQQEKAPQKERK